MRVVESHIGPPGVVPLVRDARLDEVVGQELGISVVQPDLRGLSITVRSRYVVASGRLYGIRVVGAMNDTGEAVWRDVLSSCSFAQ